MAEGAAVLGAIGAGLLVGQAKKESAEGGPLPPAEPLTASDLEAIALAGGADGPYLQHCTRIFRTDVWEWRGRNTSGGYAWLKSRGFDNSCSIGPGSTDVIEVARKLLHEASHVSCQCASESVANEGERNASRELGLL